MKVLFNTYPMAFHTPGGGEIQLMNYKENLELNGIKVNLFDLWNPNFLSNDIVHFFSVIGGSTHYCNFVKQLGLPLVISSSLWITEETKHLYPIDEIKAQLSLADLIIGNSDIECVQMSKVLEIPIEKFTTVYNGVDEIFFKRENSDIFRNYFKIKDDFILNVGNIEPRKNQLKLVEAMKSFPNKKLVLIGYKRDEEYAKKVLELAGDQVIYLKTLPNDSELLRSAYSACEVFCLPSTLETPGLAALEAAAVGAKIAITSEGATREYFGDHAKYLDPNSAESIKTAISSAMELKESEFRPISWSEVSLDLKEKYENLLKKLKDKKV